MPELLSVDNYGAIEPFSFVPSVISTECSNLRVANRSISAKRQMGEPLILGRLIGRYFHAELIGNENHQ
jgi:hypothetical protein